MFETKQAAPFPGSQQTPKWRILHSFRLAKPRESGETTHEMIEATSETSILMDAKFRSSERLFHSLFHPCESPQTVEQGHDSLGSRKVNFLKQVSADRSLARPTKPSDHDCLLVIGARNTGRQTTLMMAHLRLGFINTSSHIVGENPCMCRMG